MMKRDRNERDRDSTRGESSPSTIPKRSRSTLGRYNDDSSDEGVGGSHNSPLLETGTRRGADRDRSGSGRNRNLSPNISNSGPASRRSYDDYGAGQRSSSSGYKDMGTSSSSRHPYPYKVLCISSLHSKASDEVVRDTLYREFKRFGEISVKVVHEPDERVAYVYFRSYEDARDAKHSKSRIIIYDKPVMVEAAYESVPSGGGGGGNNSGSAPATASGGYRGQHQHHSSSSPISHHNHHQNDHYDKYYRRSPMYEQTGGSRGHHSNSRDDHHNNRYNDHRMDNHGGSSRGGPGGGYHHTSGSFAPPPPVREYTRRGGGGGGDSHHNDYMRGPPPPMSGGGGPPHHHYGRYPPGGGASSLPPPGSRMLDHGGGGGNHHGGGGHHGGGHHNHHMGPPPAMAGGGPMGGGQGAPGGPQGSQNQRYENKKDKFPNYLHHISPEDDPLATRTLFAGNLEVNITDEELRRIFGRYGTVEDIDIKRPPPGTGNAYAFVRFVNLDMASRAKAELSGQYIGKFQCKIGYGKVNATTKIWVGGLGTWTTLSQLEREFDRFGSIKKIDWVKGEQYAYITYETIDASQAAVKDMRGYPLGGPDRRLRTDFADANSPPTGTSAGTSPTFASPSKTRGTDDFYDDPEFRYSRGRNYNRGGGDDDGAPGSTGDVPVASEGGQRSPHSGNNTDIGGTSPGSDSETGPGDLKAKSQRSKESNGAAGTPGTAGLLSSARTIQEVGRRGQLGWQGALILKNSSFPTKFYLTQGHLDNVESLLKDEEGKNQLRITQRLRLDQSKLEDVLKRIATSTAHGIFLSLPSSIGSPLSSDGGAGSSAGVQSRPLRNLVSYLKQKEAAGVISLTSKDVTSSTGVLYAFPPCPFSLELLQKSCPNLEQGPDSSQAKEDHLVVVVIRGGTA